ncbi:MAG: PASTA domain-containing protein [Treponema sp.]|nr:PASTA domain-containing protein [Treponema sp.]
MDERDIAGTGRPGLGRKIKAGVKEQVDGLAYGGKPLFFTMILTLIVTVVACIGVFLASLQGAEKVMVPDVVGKSLTAALLEMQQKELYPKIQLRYSDNEGDALTILEQDPAPGAIVKAYRRVTLTVSRGQEGSGLENLVGKKIDDVLPQLKKTYGADPLVTVANPVYKKSSSPAGTILAQNPMAGLPITDRTTLHLIVSRGTEVETAEVPDLSGKKVSEALRAMASAKVIFDFTSHEAFSSEKAGTVTSQEGAGESVGIWSHVKADFAFAPAKEGDETLSGILNASISEYPYPVPMTIKSSSPEGKTSTLVSFQHDGGMVSVPYSVAKGSTLTLYALDKEVWSSVVN